MDLAHDIAGALLQGFDERYRSFRETAVEAQDRFERADWQAVRTASRERIDMYDRQVLAVVRAIAERFPTACADESLWPRIKRAYIEILYDHRQPECAETFFNSVACRVLGRTYYRNEYIFWRPAVSAEFVDSDQPTYRCFYPATEGFRRTLRACIESFRLRVPFEDLGRDLRCLVRTLRTDFSGSRARQPNFHIQVLSSLFYRGTSAYLVGRVINGNDTHPFAVAIRHVEGGGRLYLDTLLLTSAQIGRLFNLSRAYFTVDMEVPSAFVRFLQGLMPAHTAAELYTSVGLQKQGKTLFYRDLQEHLKHSTDRFVVAPGIRGMVMLVFTLPSFPYVFKVIRDSFRPPKQTSRAEVRQKYQMVKHHDRVGRMADTLEYSDVALPLARIDREILAELETTCGSVVERDGERLVIGHLYIERRMTPLDMFLRDANEEKARQAIVEYGQALRELAAADVFPGDLLCKNFGVTRAGRVVFYDYDEVSTLGELTFRCLPAPRDDAEETSAEPWFSVGPQDVFPEEWPTFIFASPRDRALFHHLHPELLDATWWSARQQDLRNGVIADVLPYPEELRFQVRYSVTA
jgi:isocitrate dehydrogenase kinase/phosphatase